MKPGGTQGGSGMWLVGCALAIAGLYLLFDSVRVTTGHFGLLTGLMHRNLAAGGETTSMGILFVPFVLSMIALFVNAKWKLAWWGLGASLAILVVEMFSRVRFFMDMKTTHLLLIVGLFGAGCGLMIRAYLAEK